MLGLKRFVHFALQKDIWLVREFVCYFAMEGFSPRFQSKVNSSECLQDRVDTSASNIVSRRLGRSHHHHLLVSYNGVGSLHTADDTLAFSFWNDSSWNHCALRTLDFLWVCRNYCEFIFVFISLNFTHFGNCSEFLFCRDWASMKSWDHQTQHLCFFISATFQKQSRSQQSEMSPTELWLKFA